MEVNPNPDLLTPQEVAAMLRCSLRAVGNYRRRGLKHVKLSQRCYRYPRAAVEALMRNHQGT